MQNIIIVNGVRQSGVTTKCNELKKHIEDYLNFKKHYVETVGGWD